jgi:hypothetical protein
MHRGMFKHDYARTEFATKNHSSQPIAGQKNGTGATRWRTYWEGAEKWAFRLRPRSEPAFRLNAGIVCMVREEERGQVEGW